MRRLIILVLLTLLPHIFTITIIESSSSNKLHWPPVKHTKLHFFLHAKLSPPNETQVVVVKPEINDLPFNFGEVDVYDQPLTVGPSISSTKLGNCQGMYIMSNQNALTGFNSMSLVFSQEIYIGSTLVLIGLFNVELTGVDLPIVGGMKYFSYAQGICRFESFIGLPEAVFVVDCDIYHRPLFASDI